MNSSCPNTNGLDFPMSDAPKKAHCIAQTTQVMHLLPRRGAAQTTAYGHSGTTCHQLPPSIGQPLAGQMPQSTCHRPPPSRCQLTAAQMLQSTCHRPPPSICQLTAARIPQSTCHRPPPSIFQYTAPRMLQNCSNGKDNSNNKRIIPDIQFHETENHDKRAYAYSSHCMLRNITDVNHVEPFVPGLRSYQVQMNVSGNPQHDNLVSFVPNNAALNTRQGSYSNNCSAYAGRLDASVMAPPLPTLETVQANRKQIDNQIKEILQKHSSTSSQRSQITRNVCPISGFKSHPILLEPSQLAGAPVGIVQANSKRIDSQIKEILQKHSSTSSQHSQITRNVCATSGFQSHPILLEPSKLAGAPAVNARTSTSSNPHVPEVFPGKYNAKYLGESRATFRVPNTPKVARSMFNTSETPWKDPGNIFSTPVKPAFTNEFWNSINSPQVPHKFSDSDGSDDGEFWVCDKEVWRQEQEIQRNCSAENFYPSHEHLDGSAKQSKIRNQTRLTQHFMAKSSNSSSHTFNLNDEGQGHTYKTFPDSISSTHGITGKTSRTTCVSENAQSDTVHLKCVGKARGCETPPTDDFSLSCSIPSSVPDIEVLLKVKQERLETCNPFYEIADTQEISNSTSSSSLCDNSGGSTSVDVPEAKSESYENPCILDVFSLGAGKSPEQAVTKSTVNWRDVPEAKSESDENPCILDVFSLGAEKSPEQAVTKSTVNWRGADDDLIFYIGDGDSPARCDIPLSPAKERSVLEKDTSKFAARAGQSSHIDLVDETDANVQHTQSSPCPDIVLVEPLMTSSAGKTCTTARRDIPLAPVEETPVLVKNTSKFAARAGHMSPINLVNQTDTTVELSQFPPCPDAASWEPFVANYEAKICSNFPGTTFAFVSYSQTDSPLIQSALTSCARKTTRTYLPALNHARECETKDCSAPTAETPSSTSAKNVERPVGDWYSNIAGCDKRASTLEQTYRESSGGKDSDMQKLKTKPNLSHLLSKNAARRHSTPSNADVPSSTEKLQLGGNRDAEARSSKDLARVIQLAGTTAGTQINSSYGGESDLMFAQSNQQNCDSGRRCSSTNSPSSRLGFAVNECTLSAKATDMTSSKELKSWLNCFSDISDDDEELSKLRAVENVQNDEEVASCSVPFVFMETDIDKEEMICCNSQDTTSGKIDEDDLHHPKITENFSFTAHSVYIVAMETDEYGMACCNSQDTAPKGIDENVIKQPEMIEKPTVEESVESMNPPNSAELKMKSNERAALKMNLKGISVQQRVGSRSGDDAEFDGCWPFSTSDGNCTADGDTTDEDSNITAAEKRDVKQSGVLGSWRYGDRVEADLAQTKEEFSSGHCTSVSDGNVATHCKAKRRRLIKQPAERQVKRPRSFQNECGYRLIDVSSDDSDENDNNILLPEVQNTSSRVQNVAPKLANDEMQSSTFCTDQEQPDEFCNDRSLFRNPTLYIAQKRKKPTPVIQKLPKSSAAGEFPNNTSLFRTPARIESIQRNIVKLPPAEGRENAKRNNQSIDVKQRARITGNWKPKDFPVVEHIKHRPTQGVADIKHGFKTNFCNVRRRLTALGVIETRPQRLFQIRDPLESKKLEKESKAEPNALQQKLSLGCYTKKNTKIMPCFVKLDKLKIERKTVKLLRTKEGSSSTSASSSSCKMRS